MRRRNRLLLASALLLLTAVGGLWFVLTPDSAEACCRQLRLGMTRAEVAALLTPLDAERDRLENDPNGPVEFRVRYAQFVARFRIGAEASKKAPIDADWHLTTDSALLLVYDEGRLCLASLSTAPSGWERLRAWLKNHTRL